MNPRSGVDHLLELDLAVTSDRMTCPRLRPGVLALLALALAGCGPTPDQIAVTALTTIPLGFLVGVFAVVVIRKMWTVPSELPIAAWSLFGVGVAFAGLLAATSPDFDREMFVPVSLYMTPALTGLCVLVARFRLAAPAERSAIAIPSTLSCLLAAPFVLGWSMTAPNEEPLVVMGSFAVLGSFVASPLITVGLTIEWLVRKPGRSQEPA